MKISKMKKALALALSAALIVPCFAGCNNKEAKKNNGKITISVSNAPKEENNPERYKQFMAQIERFEKKYPNIHVVGDEWAFDLQTFAAKAEGGTLPTAFYIPFTQTNNLIKLGYATDITKQMKEYGYYDILSDYTLENISKDGKIYYMPRDLYTMNLTLNMNLFRQAGLVDENDTPKVPQTYDELLETAKIIKEKTGKAGFMMPGTGIGGWQFTVFAWAFGTQFMKEENGKYIATFDSPECAAALQYIKDMKWKYNVLPENTLINIEEQQKLMATDQCAMCISNYDSTQNMAGNFGMKADDIGVANLPAGPRRKVSLVGGSYASFAPNATQEEIDAAFKWLTFENDILNFDDAAKKSMEEKVKLDIELGYVVGLKGLSIWNNDSEYQKYSNELQEKLCNVNPNHIKFFNDQSGIEFQTEEPAAAGDLNSTLASCIQEVLTNKDADVAAILKKANSDFQKNYLDYE